MKPLYVLLTVFAIATLILRYFFGDYNFPLSGAIAMSVMLLFTAIGHFAFAPGMALMLPPTVPYRKMMVHITGIIEIAAAVGLLIAATRHITAWLLILFFILVLPANIYAARHRVNYQNPQLPGKGDAYLWLRVPLQALFIFWVYFFIIKNG